MIGLALMALRLAHQRVHGGEVPGPDVLREESEQVSRYHSSALASEYCLLIDSIAASVAPRWVQGGGFVFHHADFIYAWEAETEEFAAEEFGGTLITRERK